MLLSAVASILLPLVIISGWPATSLIALGLIIGVNFISSGLAYISLGAAAAQIRRELLPEGRSQNVS